MSLSDDKSSEEKQLKPYGGHQSDEDNDSNSEESFMDCPEEQDKQEEGRMQYSLAKDQRLYTKGDSPSMGDGEMNEFMQNQEPAPLHSNLDAP